jgi:hypothetical protein
MALDFDKYSKNVAAHPECGRAIFQLIRERLYLCKIMRTERDMDNFKRTMNCPDMTLIEAYNWGVEAVEALLKLLEEGMPKGS